MSACDFPSCSTSALPGLRFCERHRQDLQMELALLPTPRCRECGNLMPDGAAKHDCDRPATQPPATEL
jgi:hypothetical protein